MSKKGRPKNDAKNEVETVTAARPFWLRFASPLRRWRGVRGGKISEVSDISDDFPSLTRFAPEGVRRKQWCRNGANMGAEMDQQIEKIRKKGIRKMMQKMRSKR